ncbi:MAG: cysteine--tRNA ligase [Deltaproteobacteria bacterium]|nr:cysteine--tRNA ligase [Deltaproteobacteria bacterium]
MVDKRHSILDEIGGTPLVPINRLNPNKNVQIFAKLEFFNPGGSIKDRTALFMIEEAEKSGELTRDKIILEATSGNTGIGLALVAAVKGYRILLTMSEAASEERVKILHAFNAGIKFTPAHHGTDGAIEYVYSLVREAPDKYWLADQYNNEANWMAHYHGTAMEIWEQTNGCLDVIVAAMGTTGTLMGLSRRFRELKPEVQIVGVEPYMGHKIQGLKNMKESYQPGIFEKKRLNRIINIEDEEAYQAARRLAKEEGIFAGMSSGAAVAAALRIADEMEKGVIVTILPDGGERYLSTPLFVSKKKSGLHVYNTLTRKKEEFIPNEENMVTVYSCGPTLSGLIPLAQLRRFIFSDLITRYMEFKDYEVILIMNVTDLDDRTIEGAFNAGESLNDFTEKYYQAFMEDIDLLNCKHAFKYPRASEHVDDMIDITQKLLEKGYAYEKFHSIYYDISRLKDYGRLSGIDLNKIKLGKTVDLDQYEKENPRDFTLLKRSTLNELKRGIFYNTRWGNVRPGWHLECAAMAMKYLEPAYDIHTSGVELIFPHHENVRAISKAMSGRPLANYWLHNEQVMINEKDGLNEATGNTVTLKDVINRGFSGRDVRYWMISHHYRKPLYFSWPKLETARKTISHLDHFIHRLNFCRPGTAGPEIDQEVYNLRHSFVKSMNDDFHTSVALAALFRFIRNVNRSMDRTGLSPSDRDKILNIITRINSVLAVMKIEARVPEMDKYIEALIKKREEARKNKDWDMADKLRQELKARGIELTDTKKGTTWRKNK